MSILSHFNPVKVTIFAPDGSVRAEPLAVISTKKIQTEDVSIHVEPGDEIRRPLPNGSDETFLVTDVRYSDGLHTIPPSFIIEIQRKGALPHRMPHSVSVNGPNARVTFGHDSSVNISHDGDVIQQAGDAIAAHVQNDEERVILMGALAELKAATEPASKASAYQKLVANAANHMTVLAPFLPALTQLLS